MSLVGRVSGNHPLYGGTVDDNTDDRSTPWDFFEPLHTRFQFTVDAAASADNTKVDRYWTRADNGLEQPWDGERVWCNPPYSRLDAWVHKAWDGGAELVVMLLPANRTEQRWWTDLVEPFRDQPGSPLRVEFLPGRMRFFKPGQVDSAGTRPPFGVCLLIWETKRPKAPTGGLW